MKNQVLDVRLSITNRDNGELFEPAELRLSHSVEFVTPEDAPWPEVMRKLQNCVEAYYGYEFTGYGCRAEDSE